MRQKATLFALCLSSFFLCRQSAPVWADETLSSVDAPSYSSHSDLMYYIDANGQRQNVRTIADWQVRRGHILTQFQFVAGPLPPHVRDEAPKVRVAVTEELATYVRTKLTYESEPGDWVPAYLLVPKNRRERVPAILCLHQTTPPGKRETVGLEGSPDLDYAAELAERGYVTLAPDFPYLGENHFIPYEHGYLSGTMKGIWNHIRAVDLLTSMPEVDPSRIGTIGHSLGGHNSIFVAMHDDRIRCIVSCCGYCTNQAYKDAHQKLPWYSERYMPRLAQLSQGLAEKCPFDMPELIGCLAPRPFLTVAPLHDKNFPLPGVKECIRAAAPVYALHNASEKLETDYPDAGHTFPASSRERAYAWLDRWLEHTGTDSPKNE